MAVKLRQYYIYKLTTTRLRNANYNLTLTVPQARSKGELVSIGNSEMLRSLRRIQGKGDVNQQIDALFREKKQIKRNFTPEQAHRLKEIELEIDNLLFCPQIVSVVVEDVRDYKKIIKDKFFINNKPFVRLLCGAGNSRRNTTIWVQEEFFEPLKKIMDNGRADIPIAPAKYNAYFALTASATLPVSEPYFCVIPDCLVNRTEEVDFVEEHDPDDQVIPMSMEIEFNLFDGMGLISPRQAEVWAGDMGLDYIPSSFIIRNAFMKGMVCVMDFHEFSERLGEHYITDVWGKRVNVRDMDVILTESQMKMWNAYDSCSSYAAECRKNELSWGVSRVSPKEEKNFVFSNYQFLQVLDMDDAQIEHLCQKTVEFFQKTIRTDVRYAMLYLLGKHAKQGYKNDLLNLIHDPVAKALILNNDLLKDPFVQNYLTHSLNKRIRESYIGNLILDGNYQMMISDPYALMEHMFGLPVRGLLARDEHYSAYWNKLGIEEVSACRAPLTWVSEVNHLHLRNTPEMAEWYRHLGSGIVYNVHGVDVMIQADADFDGDLVMTTNQREFLECRRGGLPITYVKHKVDKTKINDKKLFLSDIAAFDSRVGYITNCSTTLYSMLPLFEKGSIEYNEVIQRLKICRKEQGNEIDKAKGLTVKPFPRHWTRPVKLTDSITPKQAGLYAKTRIDKRPYFMRWLYSDYSKKYTIFEKNYDRYAYVSLGRELAEILNDPQTQEETAFVEAYQKYVPLLNTSCVMNRICHYMEKMTKQVMDQSTRNESDLDAIKNILQNIEFRNSGRYKEEYKKFFEIIYRKYKRNKNKIADVLDEEDGERKYKTLEQFHKALRIEAIKKINSNISELATIAVDVSYTMTGDLSFAWNVFGEGIVENILVHRQKIVAVPFLDNGGDIEYLGSLYRMMELNFYDEEVDINDYL